jgi:hypothetical protein
VGILIAIALDIFKPEGTDIARQLIVTADVLMDNYVGTTNGPGSQLAIVCGGQSGHKKYLRPCCMNLVLRNRN